MKHVWKPPPNELTWKLWCQGLGNSWKTRVESIINIFFLWFDSLQPISAPSPTEFNFDFSLIPGSVPDPLSQQPFGVLPPAKRVVFQWWFFLVCFRLWWKKTNILFLGLKIDFLESQYLRLEDHFPPFILVYGHGNMMGIPICGLRVVNSHEADRTKPPVQSVWVFADFAD